MVEQQDSQLTDGGPTRLRVTRDHGVHVMRFNEPRLDGTACREMYEQAVEITGGNGARLLIDFNGVEHINSGAMGMLVTIKKRCLSDGAQCHVVVPDDRQREMFHVMNLQLVLNLFESNDDALRKFKPPAIQ